MHIYRAITKYLLICLLSICIFTDAQIISNGKSSYRIVIDKDAVPAEKKAALELQSFIKHISGVELPVVNESASPAIYVGQSSKPAIGWNTLKPDEIILKSEGNDLYLGGARPRGSLYAVYEFLEKECGVRFWTATDTYVPKLNDLRLSAIDYRYAPPFQVRDIWYDQIPNVEFAVRLRLNGYVGYGFGFPEEWGGREMLLGGGHTFRLLLPPEKYYKDHPEWYSFRGKRIADQLCLTNMEMRRELAKNALAWLQKRPDAKMVSLTQNDNSNYCLCAQCVEFVKQHGNQSDLMIDAVNHAAEEIAKEFPDKLVETFAYQYTRTPPKSIRPRPNVIIRYCSMEADISKKLQSPYNRKFEDDLTGWRKVASQLLIWNYVSNFRKYYQVVPNWDNISSDLRFFRDNGAIGVLQQSSMNGARELADLPELRGWIYSKLLWNPDLNIDELIIEFTDGYYGDAAEDIRRYIAIISDAASKSNRKTTLDSISVRSFLETEQLLAAKKVMIEAKNKVKDNPIFRKRLDFAAVPVEMAVLEERPTGMNENKFIQLLDDTFRAVSLSSASRLRAYALPVNKEKDHMLYTSGMKHDGAKPEFAGNSSYQSWSLPRFITDLKRWKNVSLETDPAASSGNAFSMKNNHHEWSLNICIFTPGTYDVYMGVRCDSANPQGQALEFGLFNGHQWKTLYSTKIPSAQIAGMDYRLIKLGTWTFSDSEAEVIYAAPVENPSVAKSWIDRIVLIPVK